MISWNFNDNVWLLCFFKQNFLRSLLKKKSLLPDRWMPSSSALEIDGRFTCCRCGGMIQSSVTPVGGRENFSNGGVHKKLSREGFNKGKDIIGNYKGVLRDFGRVLKKSEVQIKAPKLKIEKKRPPKLEMWVKSSVTRIYMINVWRHYGPVMWHVS